MPGPARTPSGTARPGRARPPGPYRTGPFPHLRCLLVTARAGRAMLGAAADATDAGEQSLVARLVRDHPGLFVGRVFLMDRNFLGRHLITAILDAGGHLIMRVRAGINLPVTEDGWLPDGSRLTYLDGARPSPGRGPAAAAGRRAQRDPARQRRGRIGNLYDRDYPARPPGG